jgi:regulator of sigma E protease
MIEIIYIFITIGLTIFVHELGHFIAAKRLGIKVEKFSIGWGPKLFSFKRGETEYVISLLVFLGGYVKMEGEAPEEAAKSGSGAFLNQPPWKKIIISVAGVVQNALFAILLMWVVFLFGADTLKPIVGGVKKGYPAEAAGLQRGDEITRINGEKILYWNQITDIISKSKGSLIKLTALRQGKEVVTDIKPLMEESEDILNEKKMKAFIGITPLAYLPVVDGFKKGFPAETAGVKKGDIIEEINGKKIGYWDDAMDFIRDSKGAALKLTVSRKNTAGAWEDKTFTITPKKDIEEDENKKKVEAYLLGIEPLGNFIKERYSPAVAFGKALEQTWSFTDLTARSIYRMITRKMEPDVAGPIGVAQIAYKVAKTGFINLLLLISIININLALFNLLPLLPFDGGLILIFALEWISGKKVPLRAQEIMMEIGWILVILLVVFASYSDIMRIIKGG